MHSVHTSLKHDPTRSSQRVVAAPYQESDACPQSPTYWQLPRSILSFLPVIGTPTELDHDAADGSTSDIHIAGRAAMQKTVLGVHPNTYTYTKRLAEILVRDEFAKGLPVCIVRPSIVVPAMKEPLPGWVDSLNGPAGLMMGAAKGVIRSMLVDGDLAAEIIPVDTAINAAIIIAKHIATQELK